MSLGLQSYHSIEFFVKDMARALEWHTKKMGFKKIAHTKKSYEERTGVHSEVLSGPGGVLWIFTTPLQPGSTCGRFLQKHPEGVGYLNFYVKDIEKATEFLAERKAPFLYEIQTAKLADGSSWSETAIATPIGSTGFRFIEAKRNPAGTLPPGFEYDEGFKEEKVNTPYKYIDIDHVTLNTRCMQSITEFCRVVMGFEQYWGIEFHTDPEKTGLKGTGSGLESIVMRDPESKIKFATNQPLAPYFYNSQIELFIEDQGAAGVQHIALKVDKIIPAVRELREKGCAFLDAPGKYYAQLPGRMAEKNVGQIKEPMDEVQKLGILVDGYDGKYLLQLFMKEQNLQFKDKMAGPFFYEIIQREGDEGFGEGNFKALFDSIEQDQVAMNMQEMRDRIDSLI